MPASIIFSNTSNSPLLTDLYQPLAGGIKGQSDNTQTNFDKSDLSPPPPQPSLIPPGNMGLEDMVLALTQLKSKIMENKIESSTEEIKANAGQQSAKNKERIAKLEESMKKLEEANKLGEAARILGWVSVGLSAVGLIISAITSIGSIGVGALIMVAAGWTGIGAVGGALLIGAGLIGLAGTAVGAASWGVGLTLAVLKEIPAVNDWMNNTDAGKAVMWTLFAYQMATGAVSAVASLVSGVVGFVGSFATLGLKVTETGTKIAIEGVKLAIGIITAAVKIMAEIAMGSVQIVKGGLTIAQGACTFDASIARSAARHIEANLIECEAAMEEENKRLKRLIEEVQEGFSTCMAILNQATQIKQTVISKNAV
jgi:hypothetical protein